MQRSASNQEGLPGPELPCRELMALPIRRLVALGHRTSCSLGVPWPPSSPPAAVLEGHTAQSWSLWHGCPLPQEAPGPHPVPPCPDAESREGRGRERGSSTSSLTRSCPGPGPTDRHWVCFSSGDRAVTSCRHLIPNDV